MKKINLYSDLTVLEIKNYLEEKQEKAVIIPVAVIEQHGYHLPTFTDSILAEGIAEKTADKLGILYTPCLFTSYSGGCLPGTINFSPNTLVMCLRDMCTSLAEQGFKNIFIFLGHGGSENIKVLNTSLPLMIRENPIFNDVMVVYAPFWKFADLFMKGFHEGDGHGGNGETSIIMYLRPDLVSDQAAQDSPEVLAGMKQHPDFYQKHEKPCDVPEVLPRITQKDEVKVGVMGDIGAASAEKGKAIIEETVENMAAFYKKIMSERKEQYFVVEPDLGELVV